MIGHIRLIKSDGSEAEIMVEQNQVLTVGRSSKCSVRINDINLSRVHCMIKEKRGKFYIEDAGSKNGTFVDGRKLAGKEVLKSPARIDMGKTKMEFTIEEPDEVEPARPKAELVFCEMCDGSIPQAHIKSGTAVEINGEFYCRDCALTIGSGGGAAAAESSSSADKPEPETETAEAEEEDDGFLPTERVEGEEDYEFSDLDTEANIPVSEIQSENQPEEPSSAGGALEEIEEPVHEELASFDPDEIPASPPQADESALEALDEEPEAAEEAEVIDAQQLEIPAEPVRTPKPAVTETDDDVIDVIDFPAGEEEGEEEEDADDDSGPIDIIDFNPEKE